MPTVNVLLPPELADFVAGEVAAGRNATAGEVVCDGLRLLLRERAVGTGGLAVLRREIAVGLAEARDGTLSPLGVGDIARAVGAERREG